MARISTVTKKIKYETGDKVSVFGVIGTVETVLLCKEFGAPYVLLFVRFRGAEICNVFGVEDVEAVRFGGEWVNMECEPVNIK